MDHKPTLTVFRKP